MADEQAQGLASALEDLYANLYDARAAGSEVTLSGDVLTWTFTGGLNPIDEFLVRNRRDRVVKSFRQAFMESVEPRIAEVVETLTGRQVLATTAAFEPETSTTTATLVLGPKAPAEQEREAIRNWGAQVRRQSVDLRAASELSRAQHEAVSAAFAEQSSRGLSIRRPPRRRRA